MTTMQFEFGQLVDIDQSWSLYHPVLPGGGGMYCLPAAAWSSLYVLAVRDENVLAAHTLLRGWKGAILDVTDNASVHVAPSKQVELRDALKKASGNRHAVAGALLELGWYLGTDPQQGTR